MATIVNTKKMTIELDVSERDLNQLHVGDSSIISLASNPKETFSGKVERIVPAIDPMTRTGKVRLSELKMPETAQVDSLAFAEFAIQGESHFLNVPTSALVFDKNKQFVIKNESDKPRAIEIQVIHETDNQSTIRPVDPSSLKVGDQVATKGALFIFNKMNMEAS
ncbi:MAG: efflux RND transporter periplasmic adaptor subunit [Deltaproteobacteria bacterium]|nr:MAG: efflux RND transporter periplasmic adaptor subunit [Deltaproteobacteria bacterium]